MLNPNEFYIQKYNCDNWWVWFVTTCMGVSCENENKLCNVKNNLGPGDITFDSIVHQTLTISSLIITTNLLP